MFFISLLNPRRGRFLKCQHSAPHFPSPQLHTPNSCSPHWAGPKQTYRRTPVRCTPGRTAARAARLSQGPIDHSRDVLFGRSSDKALSLGAVLEYDQSWYALDTIPLAGQGAAVDVELEESCLAIVFLGHSFDRGSQLRTRSAPFRPKINEHRFVRL